MAFTSFLISKLEFTLWISKNRTKVSTWKVISTIALCLPVLSMAETPKTPEIPINQANTKTEPQFYKERKEI